jgi:hypothetical protein
MSGVALVPQHCRIELSKSQASVKNSRLQRRAMAPKAKIRAYTRFGRETALKLRECIRDISSTTARCPSASMASGNG